jgi:hypothetical protein
VIIPKDLAPFLLSTNAKSKQSFVRYSKNQRSIPVELNRVKPCKK